MAQVIFRLTLGTNAIGPFNIYTGSTSGSPILANQTRDQLVAGVVYDLPAEPTGTTYTLTFVNKQPGCNDKSIVKNINIDGDLNVIDLTVDYTPGSVVARYTAKPRVKPTSNLTIAFDNVLFTTTGGTETLSPSIFIPANSTGSSQTLTATTLNYEFVDENNVIFSGFTYNGVPSDGFNFGQDVKYDFPTPVTPTPSPSFVTPSPTPTSSPIPSVTSTPTPTPTPTSSPVCQPPGGLTVTLDLSIFEQGTLKFFLSEIGTENEETVYATSYGGSERGQEFNGWFKVAWNSDTSLWEFSQISEDGVIQQQLIATSADLYNGVWTMLTEQFPPIGTSQGEEFSCDWRYCFNVSGDTFSVIPGYTPIWSEIPLTEPPNGYFSITEGAPIIWSTGATSWFYAEGEGVLLSGGTRDALPIGSFNIDTGTTLTISSGVCEVTPLPTPFILRVDTTLGNGLDSFIITSPFGFFGQYNYDVSWEEVGNPSNNGSLTGQTGSTTVNFSSSGQYDLSIIGLFPAIINDFKKGDALKVIDIIQWGSNKWQSMQNAFNSCQNLSNYSATDTPDLRGVTGMNYMFNQATQFNGDISNWDVSSVTDMSAMFQSATSFNQDISGWNVSNVTNMSYMFGGASSFNQDISEWDVSSVQNMSGMFNGAGSFNQNLSIWDVSSVTDMNNMFNIATSFNQDISSWDVSNVTNMTAMFTDATSFNQDLSGWCVSLIPSEPSKFDDNAVAWILPKPVWGTCP